MPPTDVETVRQRIGESIPAGGSETDTMFLDTVIQDWVDGADGDLDAATLAGWEAKSAELAGLVTVQEGSSRRELSDLHKNALAQVKQWREVVTVSASSARTKIRDISRT